MIISLGHTNGRPEFRHLEMNFLILWGKQVYTTGKIRGGLSAFHTCIN